MSGWVFMNAYSVFIGIFLFIFNKKKGVQATKTKLLFTEMASLLTLLVCFDSFGRFQRTSQLRIALSNFGNFAIFLLDPVMGIFLARYISCMTKEVSKKQKWLLNTIYIIVSTNIILVSISTIFDLEWFYYFEYNTYQRGKFFLARVIYVLMIPFILLLYDIIYYKFIDKRYRKIVFAIPISIPLFGVLQIFFGDYAIEYAGMLLMLLVIFVFIQNRDISRDYLTNTINRRCFDTLLEEYTKNFDLFKKQFSVVMFDLDRFKEINDTYGHTAGDDALIEISDILKDSFKNDGKVCRFGGDEFCVISTVKDDVQMNNIIKKIQRKIDKFNNRSKTYKLGISAGYSIYDGNTKDVNEFLEIIDTKMYKEKELHHQII